MSQQGQSFHMLALKNVHLFQRMAANVRFKNTNQSEENIEKGGISPDKFRKRSPFYTEKRKPKALRKQLFTSAFRKFVLFVVFLVVLSFVTLGMTSYSQYHLTRALSIAFLGKLFGERGLVYQEISTIPDIWIYMEEVVLPHLYAHADVKQTTFRSVLQENLLLGLPRLRQIRVSDRSCKIHKDLRSQINKCFNEYSENLEEKDSFGPKNGTAWIYHTEEELGSSSYWGQIAFYSGAGSYLDLGPTLENAQNQVQHLYEYSWISRGTRVVFLDFTVYNANINIFSILKFVLEMPPAGGVWPSVSIYTLKLLRYVNRWDYFIMVLEFGFCFLTVYYLIEEIYEIRTQKLAYFNSKWNLLDTLLLILSLFSIGFSVYRTVLIDKLLENLLKNPKIYSNFETLGFWQTQSNNVIAVLVFFSWIKVFKYLSFNITMTQLSTTLAKCAKDVGGFAIMFFIIFLAYAQLGYLLFGTQLPEFSSIHVAIFTLLRVILQDFNFDNLEKANRVMGPIYFISYVFFVFFVLMNMFLAILNDTYTDVKKKMDDEKGSDKFQLINFFRKLYDKFKAFFHLRPETDTKSSSASGDLSQINENVASIDEKSESNQQLAETPPKVVRAFSNPKFQELVENHQVSVEDFEQLKCRVDDLTHEVEQVQEAILSKMSSLIAKMELLKPK